MVGSRLAPTIGSFLAPAYNEEATIAASVQSLLTLDYPNLEVVVVTDGSKDATMEVLTAGFELVEVYAARLAGGDRRRRGAVPFPAAPRLVVVDKQNGGKADALNVGLDLAAAS